MPTAVRSYTLPHQGWRLSSEPRTEFSLFVCSQIDITTQLWSCAEEVVVLWGYIKARGTYLVQLPYVSSVLTVPAACSSHAARPPGPHLPSMLGGAIWSLSLWDTILSSVLRSAFVCFLAWFIHSSNKYLFMTTMCQKLSAMRIQKEIQSPLRQDRKIKNNRGSGVREGLFGRWLAQRPGYSEGTEQSPIIQ